jgi:hypothetical protein
VELIPILRGSVSVSVRYTRSKVELAYSDIHTCPGIHPCDESTVLHLLLGVV